VLIAVSINNTAIKILANILLLLLYQTFHPEKYPFKYTIKSLLEKIWQEKKIAAVMFNLA
jgi:hypothetical protein